MGGVTLTKRFARRVAEVVKFAERGKVDKRGIPLGNVSRTPPQALFAVRVTIDGGSAGSVSATCSWTYSVETEAGHELGTEMTPIKCRLPNVPYEGDSEDPETTWGAGFFDVAGVFQLWDANECPQVEDPCPEEFSESLSETPPEEESPGYGPGYGD